VVALSGDYGKPRPMLVVRPLQIQIDKPQTPRRERIGRVIGWVDGAHQWLKASAQWSTSASALHT
jgi:hypothetical protein